MKIAQLILATLFDCSWVAHVFCITVLFCQGNRVHEICQRGDRHSSFPSQLKAASDPDASQPMPSCALQPPRSTGRDCRPHVVLCRTASAMEVWALLMRLSHFLRARGEVFAVVPLWRAAWTRCLSVEISEAAAKHCFSLCSTEHPFQTQNLSISHATQRTVPTDELPPSRPQKISSPHASVSPRVLQLYRYSILAPHDFLPS